MKKGCKGVWKNIFEFSGAGDEKDYSQRLTTLEWLDAGPFNCNKSCPEKGLG